MSKTRRGRVEEEEERGKTPRKEPRAAVRKVLDCSSQIVTAIGTLDTAVATARRSRGAGEGAPSAAGA